MHRIGETAQHYGISRQTLYAWIHNGCPCHHGGRLVYFDWQEVDAWIKGGQYDNALRSRRTN